MYIEFCLNLYELISSILDIMHNAKYINLNFSELCRLKWGSMHKSAFDMLRKWIIQYEKMYFHVGEKSVP